MLKHSIIPQKTQYRKNGLHSEIANKGEKIASKKGKKKTQVWDRKKDEPKVREKRKILAFIFKKTLILKSDEWSNLAELVQMTQSDKD